MYADQASTSGIDPSHKGNMAIYLKKVSDMNTEAAGSGWFKIWEEGYDAETKRWATERMIADKGLLSIQLPSALPTGYYLARHEIITLQNVTNDKVDAQFYVGCAQLFIQGTTAGTIRSDKQVSIPGHIDAADPALFHNIYKDDPTTYKPPGPAIFFPTTDASSANVKVQQSTQTEGVIPTTCLVKNANWCATEVPSYTDEAGCWAASENCFQQLDACYTAAPPTGSAGCKVWEEQKCAVLQQACQAGNFRGPPDAGQKLGEGAVDQPVPGGQLPAAINAGQAGQGEEGSQEAVSSPTAAAATTAAASASATVEAAGATTAEAASATSATVEAVNETTATVEAASATTAEAPSCMRSRRPARRARRARE